MEDDPLSWLSAVVRGYDEEDKPHLAKLASPRGGAKKQSRYWPAEGPLAASDRPPPGRKPPPPPRKLLGQDSALANRWHDPHGFIHAGLLPGLFVSGVRHAPDRHRSQRLRYRPVPDAPESLHVVVVCCIYDDLAPTSFSRQKPRLCPETPTPF